MAANTEQEQQTQNRNVTSSLLRKPLTIMLVCVVLFISSLSFNFLNAFLPLYNRIRGIDPIWNSIFIGVCCLGVIIACLVTPSLMSTYPTRPLLAGTAVALGVTTMLFALMDNLFEPIFYQLVGTFSRSLSGALAGVLEVISFAGLVSVYPDNVGTTTAIGEGVLNGALAFGPFLGSVFYYHGGFKMAFLILGAIFCVSSIPAVFCPKLRIAKTDDEDEGATVTSGSYYILCDPWILFPFLHLVAVQVLNTFHYPIIAIYVEDVLGEDVVWTGSALLMNSIFICVSSPLWGIIIDKYSPYTVMVVSSIFMPISYMLVGPLPLLSFIAPSKAQLMIALSIMGCIVPMGCIPAIPVAFDVYRNKHENLPQWASNALVSLYCASFPLGGFLGSTLAGFMDRYLSFRWSTGTMSLVFLVDSIICCIYCCNVTRGRKDSIKKNLIEKECA